MSHEHPPCEICGAPIERRTGERQDKWLTRKTCCAQHRFELLSRVGAARGKKMIAENSAPHAPCVICHEPFERRDGETTWNYTRRKACGGDKCLAALRRRVNRPTLPGIRVRRKALGISRDTLAREAGICDHTVSLVEIGHLHPDAELKILATLDRLEAAGSNNVPDPGWPEITAESLPAGCFGGHNLPIRAGDFQRTYPPVTHVEREANS